jgi:MoaA/NifB/PqqE/SkfB family radical SAM enzyme
MTESRNTIISGPLARIIQARILTKIFLIALEKFKNPLVAFRVLAGIRQRRARILGNRRALRYIRSGGKYYFSDNIPGWPSDAFNSFVLAEITRFDKKQEIQAPLHTVIFAITNRCYLRCTHCFEWQNISAKDILSAQDLKTIMQKLYDLNVHHIQLSGGEPLARFDDLTDLIRSAPQGIDLWILTSGFGLTDEKAVALKKAGLIGADISLDHWNEKLHNAFRNNDNSYHWVSEAVKNCGRSGILTSLSLCVTKQFISEYNLEKYLELAKSWGVCLIRLLEPRAVGRYMGKDVELSEEQKAILEAFFLKVNSSGRYKGYPILTYPGYHQRTIGCLGAGNRYFYIDSAGDIHACPFCQRKAANAVSDPLIPALASLRKTGCHEFPVNLTD